MGRSRPRNLIPEYRRYFASRCPGFPAGSPGVAPPNQPMQRVIGSRSSQVPRIDVLTCMRVCCVCGGEGREHTHNDHVERRGIRNPGHLGNLDENPRW